MYKIVNLWEISACFTQYTYTRPTTRGRDATAWSPMIHIPLASISVVWNISYNKERGLLGKLYNENPSFCYHQDKDANVRKQKYDMKTIHLWAPSTFSESINNINFFYKPCINDYFCSRIKDITDQNG
jgi:hypothetical protein